MDHEGVLYPEFSTCSASGSKLTALAMKVASPPQGGIISTQSSLLIHCYLPNFISHCRVQSSAAPAAMRATQC